MNISIRIQIASTNVQMIAQALREDKGDLTPKQREFLHNAMLRNAEKMFQLEAERRSGL